MRRTLLPGTLRTALILFAIVPAFLLPLAAAETGQDAPRFSVQTLEGRRFTNASLDGSVTLLQFWATWCPHCREDQAAVDDIDRKFSSQGLVVLAIDEGESIEKVNKYLGQHPRSCRIALDEHKEIAKRFGEHGIPYYVLIDRQGRIVDTQNGAAGEDALLDLLSQAGLSRPSPPRSGAQKMQQAANRAPDPPRGDPETKAPSGAKVIEIPVESPLETRHARHSSKTHSSKTIAKSADEPPPAKPLPKTVFVLKSGERVESDHYALDARYVILTADGKQRAIALGTLDIPATQAANNGRGIDLKIPTTANEVFVAF